VQARANRFAPHHHADQASHAGTHPIELPDGRRCVQPAQQSQHVRGVLRNLVQRPGRQPVALASPGHIGANHPRAPRRTINQSPGQPVKVTPLAGQAVHTHHHVRGRWVAPAPVSHAVLALRVRAIHMVKTGLQHGGLHNQKQSPGLVGRTGFWTGHNGFFIIVNHPEKEKC